MKCVNCGGVLSSSGCTLCGAGWITPAAIKEYWATMAYKELEAEMLHLSEQRDRLLALVRSILPDCEAAIKECPWQDKYCEPQINLSDVDDMRKLIAECEAENKPCQP